MAGKYTMLKVYHDNINQKKARIAVLISDKANFRIRKIIMGKEDCIMIKGLSF